MPTITPSSEDVQVYEIAVLYAADLSQKDEAQLLKRVEEHFADAEGKQLFKDQWSSRGLAFSVKGHREGKYVIYYYEIAPGKVREIDTAIRLDKDVLRHMIVIPPKGYEAVSFEDKYKEWIDNRETAAVQKQREREEKLKAKVEAKAKMDVKRMEAQKRKRKEEAEEAGPVQSEKISAELEKLISDEDLDI